MSSFEMYVSKDREWPTIKNGIRVHCPKCFWQPYLIEDWWGLGEQYVTWLKENVVHAYSLGREKSITEYIDYIVDHHVHFLDDNENEMFVNMFAQPYIEFENEAEAVHFKLFIS
jgi:hypothetical protein